MPRHVAAMAQVRFLPHPFATFAHFLSAVSAHCYCRCRCCFAFVVFVLVALRKLILVAKRNLKLA